MLPSDCYLEMTEFSESETSQKEDDAKSKKALQRINVPSAQMLEQLEDIDASSSSLDSGLGMCESGLYSEVKCCRHCLSCDAKKCHSMHSYDQEKADLQAGFEAIFQVHDKLEPPKLGFKSLSEDTDYYLDESCFDAEGVLEELGFGMTNEPTIPERFLPSLMKRLSKFRENEILYLNDRILHSIGAFKKRECKRRLFRNMSNNKKTFLAEKCKNCSLSPVNYPLLRSNTGPSSFSEEKVPVVEVRSRNNSLLDSVENKTDNEKDELNVEISMTEESSNDSESTIDSVKNPSHVKKLVHQDSVSISDNSSSENLVQATSSLPPNSLNIKKETMSDKTTKTRDKSIVVNIKEATESFGEDYRSLEKTSPNFFLLKDFNRELLFRENKLANHFPTAINMSQFSDKYVPTSSKPKFLKSKSFSEFVSSMLDTSKNSYNLNESSDKNPNDDDDKHSSFCHKDQQSTCSLTEQPNSSSLSDFSFDQLSDHKDSLKMNLSLQCYFQNYSKHKINSSKNRDRSDYLKFYRRLTFSNIYSSNMSHKIRSHTRIQRMIRNKKYLMKHFLKNCKFLSHFKLLHNLKKTTKENQPNLKLSSETLQKKEKYIEKSDLPPTTKPVNEPNFTKIKPPPKNFLTFSQMKRNYKLSSTSRINLEYSGSSKAIANRIKAFEEKMPCTMTSISKRGCNFFQSLSKKCVASSNTSTHRPYLQKCSPTTSTMVNSGDINVHDSTPYTCESYPVNKKMHTENEASPTSNFARTNARKNLGSLKQDNYENFATILPEYAFCAADQQELCPPCPNFPQNLTNSQKKIDGKSDMKLPNKREALQEKKIRLFSRLLSNLSSSLMAAELTEIQNSSRQNAKRSTSSCFLSASDKPIRLLAPECVSDKGNNRDTYRDIISKRAFLCLLKLISLNDKVKFSSQPLDGEHAKFSLSNGSNENNEPTVYRTSAYLMVNSDDREKELGLNPDLCYSSAYMEINQDQEIQATLNSRRKDEQMNMGRKFIAKKSLSNEERVRKSSSSRNPYKGVSKELESLKVAIRKAKETRLSASKELSLLQELLQDKVHETEKSNEDYTIENSQNEKSNFAEEKSKALTDLRQKSKREVLEDTEFWQEELEKFKQQNDQSWQERLNRMEERFKKQEIEFLRIQEENQQLKKQLELQNLGSPNCQSKLDHNGSINFSYTNGEILGDDSSRPPSSVKQDCDKLQKQLLKVEQRADELNILLNKKTIELSKLQLALSKQTKEMAELEKSYLQLQCRLRRGMSKPIVSRICSQSSPYSSKTLFPQTSSPCPIIGP